MTVIFGHERGGACTGARAATVTEPAGLFTNNNAPAGTRAMPAPRPDPLGELRDDLGVVLRVLETMRPQGMGRHRTNKIAHSLA